MYRLGEVGTGTLSHDLKRWYYKMRGWEDPYLKIGEANVRNTKSKSDYIWALKDINLEVMPGEVLGIIGKNGAGKSTLLKILSKVTGPTTGSIHYNGRIGALLEVGTGFHQELTGRENIFLNGAILGMTKAEIRGKLDEIIDFSGVERYIDTPVKRYSSGMMVRLGFAVAAHLEPEILIVDEVLAVGDAEFQKKAIGKMQDVSKIDGRTVLFVSHNMGAVKQLCNTGIVLQDGRIVYYGNSYGAINHYSSNAIITNLFIKDNIKKTHPNIEITNITANGSKNQLIQISGDNSKLDVHLSGHLKEEMRFCFELLILNENEIPLAIYNPDYTFSTIQTYKSGPFEIDKRIFLPNKINKGTYLIDINLTDPLKEFYVTIPKAIILECDGYSNSSGFTYLYKDGGWCILN